MNLALLRYATEINCKWLTRLGVTPANYLKQNGTFSAEHLTAGTVPTDTGEARLRTGANPAINLSTD